jgi:hypothetical protein
MLSYSNSVAKFNDAETNLKNFELVYEIINYSAEFEQSILSQSSIIIKSNFYVNISVRLPSGSNRTTKLLYNQSFKPIQNAIT